MSGVDIATEVAAAIDEAAAATGSGPLTAVLRKKVAGVFQYHLLNCVKTKTKIRDAMGMAERVANTLLVNPFNEAPSKGDHVAIGFVLDDVDDVTAWSRVERVEVLVPADVTLMHKLFLEE